MISKAILMSTQFLCIWCSVHFAQIVHCNVITFDGDSTYRMLYNVQYYENELSGTSSRQAAIRHQTHWMSFYIYILNPEQGIHCLKCHLVWNFSTVLLLSYYWWLSIIRLLPLRVIIITITFCKMQIQFHSANGNWSPFFCSSFKTEPQ